MTNAQERLDAISYPPTHTYQIDPLKPTGILAERFCIMQEIAPEFFLKGERLLDVGCSKGFFLLYGAHVYDEVVGLDPDPTVWELWGHLHLPPNAHAFPFGMMHPKITGCFDRILMGNVAHHLFRLHGWEWTKKLASLSNPEGCQLLIEAPTARCRDLKTIFNEEQLRQFSIVRMRMALEASGFEFVASAASPSYTPERRISLWTRSVKL